MLKENEDKPWYKEWFDENYLLLYHHRNREDAEKQVRLILEKVKPSKESRILDLGCGEGRYVSLLQELGYQVFGIDLSETLIKVGMEKFKNLNLMVGDMRQIPGHFDLILSLFTSFGYFEEDSENESVLQSVYSALNPGGIYWFDFLNPIYIKNNLVPESLSRLASGMEVLEKRSIENGRIVKNIYFESDGLKKHYRESVRLFDRETLEQMFHGIGFQVRHFFGNYKGNNWDLNSERTIIYAYREK